MEIVKRFAMGVAGIGVALTSYSVQASVDSVKIVIDTEIGLGTFSGIALGSFAYDPLHDQAYVTSTVGENLQLRRVNNVSGTQTFNTMVFATAWSKFTKGGNLDNGGGLPAPLSIVLNPQPIPALGLGTFSSAWIMDASPVVTTGPEATPHPELTQRIYRYNLLPDTNGDASDEFASIMTLQQMQAAGTFSSNLTNAGRQMAWSGDGQRLYFIDAVSTNGGIYTIPAAGGSPKLLLRTGNTANSEPAVKSSGSIDTIFFRGTGTNSGGLDKITYDGTTTSARQTALPMSAVNDFLELSSGSATFSNLATDSAGNIYVANTTTNSNLRPGIYKWDTEGRLIKIASQAERVAAFGAAKGPLIFTINKMQPTSGTFNNGSVSFPITQILYAENPQNGNAAVAAANVFKPGDFNRDNEVTQADMDGFKSVLTRKGVAASTDNLKYDLNGNGEVSWKDVKILQQFLGFPDGDATIDSVVDINDLWSLASHWQLSAQTWATGDFTGDGIVNAFDLSILALHWQQSSAGQSLESALASTGLTSLVPEPAGIALALGPAVAGLLSRRRRQSVLR